MGVTVAQTSGFCFGVKRAVSICEETARENGGCVTLGPIIHNEHAVRELEAKGVRVARSVSDILPGETVVIRSHGASEAELSRLDAMGAKIIDATCPDVKRIHRIVREEEKKGYLPVIIGERNHPEVEAISGWCSKCEVFETEAELSRWLAEDGNAQKPISLVSQTTNSKAVFNSCSDILKKECTKCEIFDTICRATSKRREEAAKLAEISDTMIVVGSAGSANTLKLADICNELCERVILAESPEDVDGADIGGYGNIGIIAGASTPAWIIKEVTRKMSEETRIDETCPEQETEESENMGAAQEDSAADDQYAEPASAPEDGEAEAEPEAEAGGEVEAEAEADGAELSGDSGSSEEPEAAADGEKASAEAEPADEGVPAEEESITAPAAGQLTADDEHAEQAEAPEPVEDDAAGSEPGSAATEAQEAAAAEPGEEDDRDALGAADESFEEMLEKSIKTLHTGQKVTGIVTSITATEVSVDLGAKQSGYVPIAEFTDDNNTDIDDIIKIGDSIETFVMRVNDVEGMIMLSKKRLDAIKNWDVIEAAKDNRTIVEGLVTEENKGGIVVNVKGVRVFVPASQTGLPKSSAMTELLRKTVKLRVTEVNQSRRRVVGSIRAVQADERREKSERVWSDIEVGKRYDGVVKSMTSYGVFVDIGGVDGMIHISELSWTRIKQPSEVMSVGDEASVYVLSFDRDTRKISLGYKKSEDNPWTRFTTSYAIGDVVNVKIVKLMPFGAFAEITPGVDGLIHISQITDHRIGFPSEVLSDGQRVDVKITEIDNDRKKVSLSIRALLDPSSQRLSDEDAARAIEADNTPVIVYDTDAPPPPEPEEDEPPEPEEDAPDEEAGGASPETVEEEAESAEEIESADADEADAGAQDAEESAE